MGKTNSVELLVDFYLGRLPDTNGRMISDIWLKDYYWLEDTHDYIQWLFPLKTRSPYNPVAPILTADVIKAFRSSGELKGRLVKSLGLMSGFYGLQAEEAENNALKIIKSEEYEERIANWLSRGNHNFLRITRMLTSLRALGLERHSKALFSCLDQIYEEEKNVIGSNTYSYWKSAARS